MFVCTSLTYFCHTDVEETLIVNGDQLISEIEGSGGDEQSVITNATNAAIATIAVATDTTTTTPGPSTTTGTTTSTTTGTTTTTEGSGDNTE